MGTEMYIDTSDTKVKLSFTFGLFFSVVSMVAICYKVWHTARHGMMPESACIIATSKPPTPGKPHK